MHTERDTSRGDLFPSEPQLLTVGEAAAILRVSEAAVIDWIDRGLLSHVTLESGEHRVKAFGVLGETVGPMTMSALRFEPARDLSPEARAAFREEQQLRKREMELAGLDYGAVDVDALTELLAARFTDVAPSPNDVRTFMGMVYVANGGIDVARMVASGDGSPDENVREVGLRALEIASESYADELAEPWPAKAGQFPDGFPPVNARISDGLLILSYGDPDAPLLVLQPIELADVLIAGKE